MTNRRPAIRLGVLVAAILVLPTVSQPVAAQTKVPSWSPSRGTVVQAPTTSAASRREPASASPRVDRWAAASLRDTTSHLSWQDPNTRASGSPSKEPKRLAAATLEHFPRFIRPRTRQATPDTESTFVRLVQGLEDLELPFPDAVRDVDLAPNREDDPANPHAPSPTDIFAKPNSARHSTQPKRDAFRDQTPSQRAVPQRTPRLPATRFAPSGVPSQVPDLEPAPIQWNGPRRSRGPVTQQNVPSSNAPRSESSATDAAKRTDATKTLPIQAPGRSRFERENDAPSDPSGETAVPNLFNTPSPQTTSDAPATDTPATDLPDVPPVTDEEFNQLLEDLPEPPPSVIDDANMFDAPSTDGPTAPTDDGPTTISETDAPETRFFGQEPSPTPVPAELNETNGQDCDANAEACRVDFGLLQLREKTDMSLDITPSIEPRQFVEPREFDMATINETRIAKLANVPSRTWTSQSGRVLTDGKLEDYREGQVHIRTLNGSLRTFKPHELSDADWCFVTGWWELPPECRFEGEQYTVRDFRLTTFTWTAPSACHRPLYFEEVAVERYGHSAGPVAQPILSGAHFFGNIVMLPYHMGLNPPNECVYPLGYYRPGNCAPWLVHGFPMTTRGIKWQGLALGAAITLLP